MKILTFYSVGLRSQSIGKVNIHTWFIERCGDIVTCRWKESISAQNYKVQPAGKANHTATWKPLKNLFKTHLLNCHWASSGPTTQTPNKICLTFFFYSLWSAAAVMREMPTSLVLISYVQVHLNKFECRGKSLFISVIQLKFWNLCIK